MTYREYVDNLLLRLDKVTNQSQVYSELTNAVHTLRETGGLSDENIRKLFVERIQIITEQQSSLEMRKNEQRYKELINSILQGGDD